MRLNDMSEKATALSEARLARAVFGPLGGVVEVGAVNSTGTWKLADVSVGDFLATRQDDVRRLLEGIRAVCQFRESAMEIVDELGRFRAHDVPAASLLLWSAGITGVPQPLEGLDDPPVVRRMCRMAADLQLAYFLQALLTAAIAAGTETRQGAAKVAEIIGIAADLADATGGSAPAGVFRMWRVAHLPGILRPESDAPESGKAGYRAYDQLLETLLVGA
ncbi:hypothetical protein [Streptomyces turgidiscabies]|uniref:Uncharacterized protein n=2 Tax=Streptomyces TaxID=1883 RepID=L7EYY2_STRT8|nr:hypothetical protein STRTUCAR8_04594 [Streptomyces turgidiscabies Car8]GAQ75497.1 hypothetical protein T45_07282 [Streptomyces turgidiscabies]